MTYYTVENIRELDITLEDLYNEKEALLVFFNNYDSPFDLTMATWSSYTSPTKTPDCMLSSWGHNLYFRTPKGLDATRYTSVGSLQTALRRVSRGLLGATEVRFAIRKTK